MGSGLVDTTASSAADVGRDVVAATVATVAARGLEPQDANPLPELGARDAAAEDSQQPPSRVKEEQRSLARSAPPTRPGSAHNCARLPAGRYRTAPSGSSQSDYGTPPGPAATAEPRDRKKPAEGRSSVSVCRPSEVEHGLKARGGRDPRVAKMKVKMLSRNPDNYVRETKLDIQRGERDWNRRGSILPDSLGLASFRAVEGAGGQRSGLLFPFRLGD